MFILKKYENTFLLTWTAGQQRQQNLHAFGPHRDPRRGPQRSGGRGPDKMPAPLLPWAEGIFFWGKITAFSC